jgi:hypothetical protein
MLDLIDTLSAQTDIQFEWIDGQIVPKEGEIPLSQELIDLIISPDFDLLHFQQQNFSPMAASLNHNEIMATLNRIISQQINFSMYAYYVNGIKVSRKLFGSIYIPDLCEISVSTKKVRSKRPFPLSRFYPLRPKIKTKIRKKRITNRSKVYENTY